MMRQIIHRSKTLLRAGATDAIGSQVSGRIVALPEMWIWTDFHLSDFGVNQDLECSLQQEVNCPQRVYRVLPPMRSESEAPFENDFAS
jgi:hypothetical protein